jgi:hypothetical protein
MEAELISQKSVNFYQTTRNLMPEDSNHMFLLYSGTCFVVNAIILMCDTAA